MTTTGVEPAGRAEDGPSTGVGRLRRIAVRLPEDRLRFATTVLFAAGAVLMPLGLFAVGYGWYGAAHTKYDYDQIPYLISGGLVGVCLTTIGCFLYFGAWIARGQAEERAAAQQLQESLRALPELLARELAALSSAAPGAGSEADLVVAGANGAAVHRRDCRLIADRDDLRPYVAGEAGRTPCRVCGPVLN